MGERASNRSKYETEGEDETGYWETRIYKSETVKDGMAKLVVDFSICIITLTAHYVVHEKCILALYKYISIHTTRAPINMLSVS
jgi:hypothetical protein